MNKEEMFIEKEIIGFKYSSRVFKSDKYQTFLEKVRQDNEDLKQYYEELKQEVEDETSNNVQLDLNKSKESEDDGTNE